MSNNYMPVASNRLRLPAPTRPAATVYAHPEDVANNPKLTAARKRAILASWISDARAVENAPTLRRLDSGAVVEVDAILRALVSLDELATNRGTDRNSLAPSARRRSVISRWLGRVGLSNSSNDDDDPPPAPAGFGIPFRPFFVAAHCRRAEQFRRLACAIG
jgi:hypothetical protein